MRTAMPLLIVIYARCRSVGRANPRAYDANPAVTSLTRVQRTSGRRDDSMCSSGISPEGASPHSGPEPSATPFCSSSAAPQDMFTLAPCGTWTSSVSTNCCSNLSTDRPGCCSTLGAGNRSIALPTRMRSHVPPRSTETVSVIAREPRRSPDARLSPGAGR